MSKQRKVPKKQRRLRREEQRRQARDEAAPLDDVLVKDLTYLAERGVMASTERFEDAAFDAMYKSSRWRTEPEFADLSFDPVDAGQAITRIVSEEPDLADQVKRLRGSAREDKAFDVNRRALAAVMTPAFKQQFFTRLSRFRQRLAETDGDVQEALLWTAARPGKGILRNAMLFASAFSVMLFAPLTPYVAVGAFIVSMMLLSALLTILFLPALVMLGRRWLLDKGKGA